ncbi:hypothetical protein [Streptomyces sp. B6B3]|uniref:hypothetical protein n=1 Tax=Streptomyces sp. B6B3 TaxID=3153570 RepID=UPI00325CDDA0
MSTSTAQSATRKGRRTLAQKLQWLRDLTTPPGEQPPSYDSTARRITETTGISISGPYYWELVTGRSTNPKLSHLRALAMYYRLPIGYLSDEDADVEQLESELEVLHALKQRGVRSITLQGATETAADLPTLHAFLARLQLLTSFGDEVRETALRVSSLTPQHRNALTALIDDPALLDALEDDDLRTFARWAGEQTDERLATVHALASQPALLDALQAESFCEMVLRFSQLSHSSQQVVRSMVDHISRVENPR